MENINYNLEMEKIIQSLNGEKKKLLIHSCCGPCSSAVLERLNNFFNITVLYYNPNIDNEEEFNKRVIEQQKIIDEIGKDNKIELMVVSYNSKEYYDKIKGYEDCMEGGERCSICFELRLDMSARIAKEYKYDYFTTTLSISPHKNARLINEIGEKLSKKYDISYLYSDFKKKNGYKRSIELSKKYNLYRQDYCGCRFSKIESENRRKDKEE